ncbi:MAG: ABC transporter permease [Gammaproteobacteria bacterium]|nr:ABC transporter permease [Gammaproteobacteria bacterium]
MSHHHAQRGHTVSARFHAWLAHHGESLHDALRRLKRRPFGYLLSMLVIAVSLTIPITLLATLHGARTALAGWTKEAAQLQLFLKPTVSHREAEALLRTLREDPLIAEPRLITPEEGLAQLARAHALDGVLSELKDNPLPTVIELKPRSAADLEVLRTRLAVRPEVDTVRMDSEAVQRLRGLINAGERLTLIFLIILAPALAITVGNTIRLELERHAEEVRLLQLIGATHAFIRRPLLYAGAILGLGGTLLGLLFAGLAMRLLLQAAADSGWLITLPSLPPYLVLTLIPIGTLLGILAAWLASALQIRRIHPA